MADIVCQGETAVLRARSINSEGDGICDLRNGPVIFVPMLLAGEEALVRIVKIRRSYGVGRILELRRSVAERAIPFCRWYGRCGGCSLQHAVYPAQLTIKENLVADAMTRLGGFDVEKLPLNRCIPSSRQHHYRNKASFPAQGYGDKVNLGFFSRGSHRLIPIDNCPLIEEPLEEIFVALREALPRLSLKAYDERTHQGDLRHVIVRCGSTSGDGAVLLVLRKEPSTALFGELRAFARKMRSRFPAFRSWAINIQPQRGNVIIGSRTLPLSGDLFLEERLGDYVFRMDLTAFFQVNATQAEALYRYVVKSLDVTSTGPILELFSGVGGLTAYIASSGRRVMAVESWQPSMRNLAYNMRANGMSNVTLYDGRAEDFFQEKTSGDYDIVVLDPPRSGCAAGVLQGLTQLNPRQILYVSCNPSTLARDLAKLCAFGYHLASLTPFDFFPQTAHVETVAVVERI